MAAAVSRMRMATIMGTTIEAVDPPAIDDAKPTSHVSPWKSIGHTQINLPASFSLQKPPFRHGQIYKKRKLSIKNCKTRKIYTSTKKKKKEKHVLLEPAFLSRW